MKPSRRRPVVEYLCGGYQVSERRACGVARIARSTQRYRSSKDPQTALRQRIREIAQARVRYGYRKIRVLLNREGWKVGKKRVYRLYREEGLTLRQRPRISASEPSPDHPMKCGVWISWPTNWPTAAASVL